MKKNFYFVALVGMLALSACSKDQEGTDGQPTDALSSMTVKLESPKTYATSTPVGNESKLTNTHVYVLAKKSADGTGDEVEYKHVVLGEDVTQATIKYPIEKKTVFALANISDAEAAVVAAFTTEDQFKNYVANIEKSYIGTLTQDGSFIMSGKAVVNNAAGTVPYTLPITLNRDIAKNSFHVQQVAIAGTEPAVGAPTVNSVDRIYVVRGAAKTQPFNMDGNSNTGYSLTPGFGQVGYVGDYAAELLDATTIDNSQITAGATDFTFEHPYMNKKDDVSYIFDPFYVLPNYAETAVCGTIIILEATITNAEGNFTNAKRYYKARISDNIGTYDTRKNTHYIITATLKGNGTDKPNPAEDEKDNLVVTVKVADWALVLSSQEIE